jgi:hypothetical protein
MTHINVVTMNVPITAYTVFIVLSFVVCPSDSVATVNQKYVSYYILIKTKHKKIRKQ